MSLLQRRLDRLFDTAHRRYPRDVAAREHYIRTVLDAAERMEGEHYWISTEAFSELARLFGPLPRCPWRGLGDVVASITRRFGVRPCGACRRRQTWLNRLLPFKWSKR